MNFYYKYNKYKSKYLALGRQMGAGRGVIKLAVWRQFAKGVQTPYHVTVCFMDQNFQEAKSIALKIAKKYFGHTQRFILKFNKQWGKKSILTSSWNPKTNKGLEEIRKEILDAIGSKYSNSINTDRYKKGQIIGGQTVILDGLPPQHIEERNPLKLKKLLADGQWKNVYYRLT